MAVAIAKDTVQVVGGLGTQANAAATNGGGATKAAWDAGSPSDFIHTNGGPKAADTGCSFSLASKRVTGGALQGAEGTVGALAYVSGTNITTGWYEITDADPSYQWVELLNIVASGDNADTTINIGGAIDTLQNALDINDASSYNRYIYDNIDPDTLGATADVDTYGGTQTTRVFVIGYNSTLTAEAEVEITTDQTLANGLVDFSNAAVDYVEFWNIDFNAGGKDSSLAAYGVYNSAAGSDVNVFRDCKFRGASSDGMFFATGTNLTILVNCEASLNGRDGFNPGKASKISACSSHDNDRHGFYFDRETRRCSGSVAYDNGKGGTGNGFMVLGNATYSSLIGNTAFNNNDDGFQIDDTAENCTLINNASVGNSGYGYDLQGLVIKPTGAHFSHNLAADNTGDGGTTTCCTEVLDTAFAAMRHGNNVASAQAAADIFVNVNDGSEDFTPKTGSDLIDAGLDAEATGEQDIGAIQQAAGGGAGGGMPILMGSVVR